MNDNKNNSESTNIGLRKLSEEDYEFLLEEIEKLAHHHLSKKVPEHRISDYDILIDINNDSGQLDVEIDISHNLSSRVTNKYEKIIREVIANTFEDLDKLLKEKFTN